MSGSKQATPIENYLNQKPVSKISDTSRAQGSSNVGQMDQIVGVSHNKSMKDKVTSVQHAINPSLSADTIMTIMQSVNAGKVAIMNGTKDNLIALNQNVGIQTGGGAGVSKVYYKAPNVVQTSNGTLVYRIDSVFTIGNTSKVEARIIKQVGKSATNTLVSLTHQTKAGVIKTQIIQVGDIMDMSLVSLDPDAFVINKVSSGDQVVTKTAVTEWIWGVTPKKIGQFDLILKATIRENNAANDKIVFDKTIDVVNRPKRNWSYDLKIPNKLINEKPNIIGITITQKDSANKNTFKWGGFGEIRLEFNNELDYTVVVSDTDNMTDAKSLFINKWIVTPNTKIKVKNDTFRIKLIGNYEQYVICQKDVTINPNFKSKFSDFISKSAQQWYWVFSTLLIPLGIWIKKKYYLRFKEYIHKKRHPRGRPRKR